MGIVAEFEKFDARLRNRFWSVSSINTNNELVVSLWGHEPFYTLCDQHKKVVYKDNIDRWSGHGNKELRRNLDKTFKENLHVRHVVSKLKKESNLELINQGAAASKFPKTCSAETNWIGKLTKWDGVNFEFEFTKEF